MHAKKRKSRIRDWINQITYQASSRWHDLIIFTAERNDPKLAVIPGKSHNAITEKTRTIDQTRGFNCPASRFQDNFARAFGNALDFTGGQDLAAVLLNQLGVLPRDLCIVGDACS